MSRVIITKSKLDSLADAISVKATVTAPLTIDQMVAAVNSINPSVTPTPVSLQTKTATPSTGTVIVTPDSGYDGLAQVNINPIPSNYKDVSNVTATPADVINGKSFVDTTGTRIGSLIVKSYYTGSATPSSSFGTNGDLYFQTEEK